MKRLFDDRVDELLGMSIRIQEIDCHCVVNCALISEATDAFMQAMSSIGVPINDALALKNIVGKIADPRYQLNRRSLESELKTLLLSYRNERFFKNLIASRYIQAVDPSSTTPTVTVRNARDL